MNERERRQNAFSSLTINFVSTLSHITLFILSLMFMNDEYERI